MRRVRGLPPIGAFACALLAGAGAAFAAGTGEDPSAAPPASPASAVARGAAARDWRTGARVVIHAVPEGERLSGIVAGLFEELGATDVERRTVEAVPAEDQVRWFHAGDEGMAREVAAVLEPVFGSVRAIGLTGYESAAESGLIEIWLR